MSDLRTSVLRLANQLPSGDLRGALRTLVGWDSSVLGLTPSDLEDMEPDEKKDAARDLLNQAGDLAEAVAEAFESELGAQKSEVVKAAKALQQAARKVPR